MPKLTIITINFNHIEGLRRTIESVANQTYADYEWIVVDGGSTDGSKELLERYQDRFAWWCSEPDKGVYNAMNKGLAHATGMYVNFMNSGDTYALKTTLADVFEMEHSADIVYGVMKRCRLDGEPMGVGSIKNDFQWYDIYIDNIGHQAEFAKRVLYQIKKFDENYKLLADWDWNAYMIAVERVSVEFIPKVLCIYEAGGLSDKLKPKADEELQIIRNKYFCALTRYDILEYKSLYAVKKYWLTRVLYKLVLRVVRKIYLHKEIIEI